MVLRNKLAAFTGGLILAAHVFAGQEIACPDIADIQAEGVTMAEQLSSNIYFTYHFNTYKTDSTWGFVLAPIAADSIEVAIENGNNILKMMSAPGVPEMTDNELVCTYPTSQPNIMAAAIKSDQSVYPMKLKRFVNSKR